MKYHNDISQLIGKTPLVKISRINPFPGITILAKLEKFNPAGSVKDRVAKYLIETGEKEGLLTRDRTVIEATSGNTGIGLAMVCALKGYQCELVMPESMSAERIAIMQAYGAIVTLTPTELGINGAQDYVRDKITTNPEEYFNPNQYDNPANWLAHYETTAEEILEDTDGRVTHFVAGLGTSGTLMGVAKRLREELDDVHIISVEPNSESFIQGLKDLENSYVPHIFESELLDGRLKVKDTDAERVTQALGLEEGIFVGQSSGAAMWGALEVARNLHDKGKRNKVIVVLLADSGEKYISSGLFSASLQVENPIQQEKVESCCSDHE
ncbi:MAG: PLP-dependent cysteine synthase family protein [Candidatus Thorarchaeota archaeon]|jgi:cysteine synthase